MKKLICVILVIIMSVNCYAAVISDNDGSAFVTKQEFEALKKSFNSQISNYNTSIDKKIDGAIASYLSGISISETPLNLYEKILYSTNGKLRWCNEVLDSGTDKSNLRSEIVVNTTRYYRHDEIHVYTDLRSHGNKGDSGIRAGIIYQVSSTKKEASLADQGLLCRSYFYGPATYLSSVTAWTDQIWCDHGGGWPGIQKVSPTPTNIFTAQNVISDGNGQLWELNKLPNNKYELKKWNTKAFISNKLEFIGYSYNDFSDIKYNTTNARDNFFKYYTKPGGMDSIGAAYNLNMSKGTGFTVPVLGAINGYGALFAWHYGKQDIGWTKVDDDVDYSLRFYANNTNHDINAITDEVVPDWATATQISDSDTQEAYHTYVRPYYPPSGPANEDVKVSRINYSFYNPSVSPLTINLHSIVNQYVGLPLGEDVYHGEGAPAFETISDGSRCELKNVTLNLYDSDNKTPISGDVIIKLSSERFLDGDYRIPTDKLYEQTYTVPSTGTLTIPSIGPFTIDKARSVVWINLYEVNGNGKMVDLAGFDVK